MSPRRGRVDPGPPGTPRDDRVRVEPCPRCGRTTLRALVECGDVRVDPTPVDEHAEALALIAGRSSYDLHTSRLPGYSWLGWRSALHIRDGHEHPVLLPHVCEAPAVSRPRAKPPPTPVITPAIPQTLF